MKLSPNTEDRLKAAKQFLGLGRNTGIDKVLNALLDMLDEKIMTERVLNYGWVKGLHGWVRHREGGTHHTLKEAFDISYINAPEA